MLNGRRYATRRHTELESVLQRKVLKDLETRNVFSFKCLAANKRGVPDVILCASGKFISIELKRSVSQKNHVRRISAISELQRISSDAIKKHKGLAFFASSFEEYSYILNTIEKRYVSGRD